LWSNRHDTGSWDTLRPETVTASDEGLTAEARSQAVYQRLVFDLTSEAITSVCDSMTTTADTSSEPWRHHRLTVTPPCPQSADEAKPLITDSVLKQLGLESDKCPLLPRYSGQVRGRRRADLVDRVLDAELVSEESSWTDFTGEELSVKMQVADMLCDMLMSDTVVTLLSVGARKRCHRLDEKVSS